MMVMSVSTFYREIGLEQKLPFLNKKLDKKIFYDYADLNKKEKDVITKYIERMELTYLLTPSTINIQPFISEEIHFEGVMYITVRMREEATEKQVTVIEEVIHGALPNPVIIVFHLNDEILVSTCMKRLNKVNQSSVVLSEIHRTAWISLHDLENTLIHDFIQSIHLTKVNFSNFFEFYKEIDLAVQAYQQINIVGSFQVVKDDKKREQQQIIIGQINETEQEMAKLKKAIKNETQFNKKVEFNIKIQQLAKRISELRSDLEK
jgi:DNA primase large subunit